MLKKLVRQFHVHTPITKLNTCIASEDKIITFCEELLNLRKMFSNSWLLNSSSYAFRFKESSKTYKIIYSKMGQQFNQNGKQTEKKISKEITRITSYAFCSFLKASAAFSFPIFLSGWTNIA